MGRPLLIGTILSYSQAVPVDCEDILIHFFLDQSTGGFESLRGMLTQHCEEWSTSGMFTTHNREFSVYFDLSCHFIDSAGHEIFSGHSASS